MQWNSFSMWYRFLEFQRGLLGSSLGAGSVIPSSLHWWLMQSHSIDTTTPKEGGGEEGRERGGENSSTLHAVISFVPPPLLCYNCIFIHNLQRVCWQQQLVSHSCRGGDSNLILARPLCSPKLCQCFPELFQASNSLQKPFLNLIRCLFICQLRLGYL